ncbi:MAG: cytochrome C [Firmicutes bacterium]|nr:cytochrome C [Bacillota bacterium]
MKKKALVIGTALVMALQVAACGSSSSSTASSTTAATEAATTAATEAAAADASTEATTEAAAEATTEEAIATTGSYTIYNETGEKVTELTVTRNDATEDAENYAGDAGLADGESVTVDKDYPDATADTTLTLTFTTESGYTASFTTLGLEEAPITLLAADAMTGATPINFSIPQ